MSTVLVVEDETDLLEVLRYNLQQQGHQTIIAGSANRALQELKRAKVDLVILDLMLPDGSGTDLCRIIRSSQEHRETPIIMLTARSEEVDRVVGFEVGADDYVTKPFSVRELLLRVNAVLRRQAAPQQQPLDDEEEIIEFGNLRIAREAHRVFVSGEEIELSALEFRLLIRLYESRNRVQTRGQLLERVWGLHADLTTRTVDSHVKRLREKLGDARNYVETVRGVGYRFVEAPPTDPADEA